MKHNRQTARDISYAYSARTYSGRAVIKILENITGRIGLIRKAKGYEHEINWVKVSGILCSKVWFIFRDFRWEFQLYSKRWPLILVANHPFGILDGLILGYIMSKSRQDFKILANQVFCKSDDLNDIILPISFDETKEASKMNIATRLSALNFLDNGGAIGVFPEAPFQRHRSFWSAYGPGWRSFTAKMITRSDAQVVPIFFKVTIVDFFKWQATFIIIFAWDY